MNMTLGEYLIEKDNLLTQINASQFYYANGGIPKQATPREMLEEADVRRLFLDLLTKAYNSQPDVYDQTPFV